MLLEVIATTVDDAIAIEKAGGNRIELVSGLTEGGLTPSIGLIEQVANAVSIDVFVMLRVHSKDFIYSDNDMKVMLEDIKAIRKTKAKGIVFGSLNDDKTINEEQLRLVNEAKGDLKLTVHRAFDEARDQEEALQTLLKYDVTTILTSAGASNALIGVDKLNELAKRTEGKINILAGVGLNSTNIEEFVSKTKCKQIHIGSGARYNNSSLKDIDPKLCRYIKDVMDKK